MANTYKSSGKRITIKSLSAAVASGVLCREKGFIGIAIDNQASGKSVSFAFEGVYAMTYSAYAGKGSGALPVAGTILYWDTSTATLSMGADNDDYPAVKVITDVSSTNGSFDGLLLPQGRPYGQEQS